MLLQSLHENNLYSSFKEMRKLQEKLNRMMAAPSGTREFPAVNIWNSDKGAVLRAVVPGVEPGAIDISIVNDTITIKGNTKTEDSHTGGSCHKRERPSLAFSRSFRLPFGVEQDAIQATLANGILEIHLPRAEQEKPRRITIQPE